jgi:hypothetical protein
MSEERKYSGIDFYDDDDDAEAFDRWRRQRPSDRKSAQADSAKSSEVVVAKSMPSSEETK